MSTVKINHTDFGYALTAHVSKTDGSPFACTDCHTNGFVGFDQAICSTCHAQSQADFMKDHLAAYGTTCLDCHDGVDTYGHAYNHNLVAFKLDGKHAQTACSQCHTGNRTIADMQATKQDCYSCHAKDDVHQGELDADCGSCHTPAGWLPATFDHNLSSFKLIGKHVLVACVDCHVSNAFKGTPQDCYSCHTKDDVHQGLLGQACETCHTPASWTSANFDHNTAAFKLDGKHAGVACNQCHTDLLFKNTPTDCNACHSKDDVHNAQLGPACFTCHTTAGWTPSTFDHGMASFKLTGKHVGLACNACHSDKIFKTTSSNCSSCHAKDDAHGGQFGASCGTCHSTSGWLPATFDHNLSSFKLTGKHVSVSCNSCHKNGVFKGTPTNCYACHANNDAHGGAFGTNCGACHSTNGWTPATFDHNLSSFKLIGKHSSVSCNSCHINGVFKGTPTSCYACHARDDAHGGAFGTNCGSCHTPNGWTPATFDHSLVFALTGAHAGLSCNSCHTGSGFGGLSTACSSCHGDPAFHAGLFSGTPCSNCHNTSAWTPASYTGSHPGGCDGNCINHENASCRDCHTTNLMTATCTKCHDSNNPGGGD
jgi:hypothetical protein